MQSKKLVYSVLILSLTLAGVQPRPAKAAIALAVDATGFGVFGPSWVFYLCSLGGFIGTFSRPEPGERRGFFARVGFFLAGVIFLDEKSGGISFSALTEDSGRKLGLSDAERESFNAEREPLSAVLETIRGETEAKFGADNQTPEAGNFVRERWAEYRTELSEGTSAAFDKLVAKASR